MVKQQKKNTFKESLQLNSCLKALYTWANPVQLKNRILFAHVYCKPNSYIL